MGRPDRDALVPWPHRSAVTTPDAEDNADRLMVFVPAIMSVGLLFSLLTVLRDLFRWVGGRARDRRTAIEAAAVTNLVLGHDEPEPAELGMLSRRTYLVVSIVLAGTAAYIAIGSTANFLRDGGYVRDIAWLLAVSLALSGLFGYLAGVTTVVFRSWPAPPPWVWGPLRTAPLSVTPGRVGLGPSWALTASTLAAAVATGFITLVVGSGRSIALDIDRPILRWFTEAEWMGRLGVVDPFGGTIVSLVFVALIGLSAFRCRVMAITFPLAFVVAWSSSGILRMIVERPRPLDPLTDRSFPSGHLVQAIFIAGLVPLALHVLFDDRRLSTLSRGMLTIGVIVTAMFRLHRQDHWPLDALASVTLGLTVVFGVHWIMAHTSLHRGCPSCRWSRHPHNIEWSRGMFTLSPETARRVGLAGALSALGAAAALAIGTVAVGIPEDPEGYGLGSAIATPVQIGLAALMALAGLVALRWRATGALLMAIAATGLGLFASVEYRPLLATTLTGLLLIPAVLTWLAWQPRETLGRIIALAAATATLMTGAGVGAVEIYDYYFGPTHPDSTAPDLDSYAGWLWLGGVGADTATIVAGGLDADEQVVLHYRPVVADGTGGGGDERLVARADAMGLARFTLADLAPERHYGYRVLAADDESDQEVGGGAGEGGDEGAGPDFDAVFTTMDAGPQDLTVAVASCARTASNGAVYDAIVAAEPDLYLAIGDLHYGNLESTDPVDHVTAYGRSLRRPGQAALFSSIPTAYVWDDHDFGPNDSDGTSPSREAVSVAYRAAVPHYGVDPSPEASIAQAFTVGRVRFVLTDTRSKRVGDTMLGREQLDWLIDELTTSAAGHALVVWANPTPWIGAGRPGADDWSAYPDERQAVADALARAGVENLVMVSGDAHMVAIDDGTNSGYASIDGRSDGAGFPLLHAAALDRPGSVKGGPYSHGAFPGFGQFGLVRIVDDGGPTIDVRLSGHTWQHEELVHLELTIDVPPGVSR
jgi:hypothetical protein